MSEQIKISFSAPFKDDKQVDRLVRSITEAMPLGVTLDSDNRKRLMASNQPYLIGEVDNHQLSQSDFNEVFAVACSSVDETIAVALTVGQARKPRINLRRQGETVRALKAPKRKAADLLYGPRRA